MIKQDSKQNHPNKLPEETSGIGSIVQSTNICVIPKLLETKADFNLLFRLVKSYIPSYCKNLIKC